MRLLLANLLIRYTPCTLTIRTVETSLEWIWRGNSLRWDFTRARRYANHSSGRKYTEDGRVRPQETDALHNVKAKSAKIFKEVRDRVAYDPEYVTMRKEWRASE